MNNKPKHYKLRLTCRAPIFIGSGKEISKKEYLMCQVKILVLDFVKLYRLLEK